MTKALGMIETLGIGSSIRVADIMLKSADVRLLNQEQVSMAFYTVFVEGDIVAVEVAIEAGKSLAEGSGSLIAYNILPRPEREIKKLYKKSGKYKNTY